MVVISKKLRDAIRLNRPAYRIAHRARLHPSTLYKLTCGIELIKKPNDERVIAIGRVLGIPANECFEDIGTNK